MLIVYLPASLSYASLSVFVQVCLVYCLRMLAVHLDPDNSNDSLRRACSLSDLSFQASPSDKKKSETGKLILIHICIILKRLHEGTRLVSSH